MTSEPRLADLGDAHLVMFHHFHGGIHPAGQGSLSADDLDEMLDHLADRFRLVGARTWMERCLRGTLGDRDVALSFDDNLRCQYDIALPVLQSRGLDGFWFVYTSPLEGALERVELYRWFRSTHFADVDAFYTAFEAHVAESPWADTVAAAVATFHPEAFLPEFPFYSDADRRFRFVRDDVLGPEAYNQVMDQMIAGAGTHLDALASQLWIDADGLAALARDGHVVGLHSHTHPTRLAQLDAAHQRAEYEANAAAVLAATGVRPTTVAHPCGSFNDHTLDVLRDLGMELGFRAHRGGPPRTLLELPRDDHANVWRRVRGSAA